MKLNLDCVRDILLSIEELTDGFQTFTWANMTGFQATEQFIRLHGYNPEEVSCHVVQCMQHGFLKDGRVYPDGGFSVRDLSPEGHAFIANIRNDGVWQATKERIKPLGTVALGVATQIASQVVRKILNL